MAFDTFNKQIKSLEAETHRFYDHLQSIADGSAIVAHKDCQCPVCRVYPARTWVWMKQPIDVFDGDGKFVQTIARKVIKPVGAGECVARYEKQWRPVVPYHSHPYKWVMHV